MFELLVGRTGATADPVEEGEVGVGVDEGEMVNVCVTVVGSALVDGLMTTVVVTVCIEVPGVFVAGLTVVVGGLLVRIAVPVRTQPTP